MERNMWFTCVIVLSILEGCSTARLQQQVRFSRRDGGIQLQASWQQQNTLDCKRHSLTTSCAQAYQHVQPPCFWRKAAGPQTRPGLQHHNSIRDLLPQAVTHDAAAKQTTSPLRHSKPTPSLRRTTRALPSSPGLTIPGDTSSSSSSSSDAEFSTEQKSSSHFLIDFSAKMRASRLRRRRSLLQISTLPYSIYSSVSTDPDHLFNTMNGISNTAWNTANTIGVLKGDSLNSVGDLLTTKGSIISGGSTAEDLQRQQRYVNAGDQLAYAMAPSVNQAHSTAQDIARTLAPMAQQLHQDKQDLAAQSADAAQDAMASLAEGKATVINTIQPFIHNGGTGPVDIGATAVKSAATATQTFMHGTAVPMASGALTAASNIGNYLGNGFQEGFYEGYQASMDRRPPYADADFQKQQFEQQPALYLPSSFFPLGAMANITYPCPQAPNSAVTAPVGTIIGPGIPCGVPLMLVPRSAVPTNQLGPTVVQPTPTYPPVSPPPSPTSPTPIPVTPLPPGASPAPPGGGGTTLPPDITPPNVRPPDGTTPAPSPIPTVPPNTGTPTPTPDPTPTPTPTPSPEVPGGLQPPNIQTRGYSSSNNYMSLEAAQQQQRMQRYQTQQMQLQQQVQQQQRLQQQGSQRVVVTGPYSTAAEAAAAAVARGSGLGTSNGGSRSGNTVLRQQSNPSLLSILGGGLRALLQELHPIESDKADS